MPTTELLKLVVEAVFKIPDTQLKHKVPGQPYLGRIDVDNLLKIVGDGLNKIVWVDDRQIVEASVTKKYGSQSSLTVSVFFANQI